MRCFLPVRSRSRCRWYWLRSRVVERNHHLDHGAWIPVGELQFSSEFFDPLSHPSNPHANTSWSQLYSLFPESFPVVTNRDNHVVFPSSQVHPRPTRLRMPKNIGERLLHDTEDRSFQLRRKPRKIGRLDLERGFDPAALG